MSPTKRALDGSGRWWRALAVGCALAIAQTSAAGVLTLERWSVDAGGTSFVSFGPYKMGGTIGQHDNALLTGAGFAVSGGFWVPGAPVPVGVGGDPGPDPDPPPGPDTPPPAAPSQLRIYAAVPNPLQGGTRIALDLPTANTIEARVFDVHGALVRTLAMTEFPAGRHVLDWDVRDGAGSRVGAGLYFTRIRVGTLESRQKLVVLR
jgi:hypothetical protein